MDFNTRSEQYVPTHSRTSSNGSVNSSSPVTSGLSTRAHSRWPSSSSSVITAPDSPAASPKSGLNDLLEGSWQYGRNDLDDEPFCICDLSMCEHRQRRILSEPDLASLTSLYTTSKCLSYDRPETATGARRGSATSSDGSRSNRIAQRLRSMSRSRRPRKGTASSAAASIVSAPPSRSASGRQHPRRNSNDPVYIPPSPSTTSVLTAVRIECCTRDSPGSGDLAPNVVTTRDGLPVSDEESLAGIERSATPLLPRVNDTGKTLNPPIFSSPLQSPRVAPQSPIASNSTSPAMDFASLDDCMLPLSQVSSLALSSGIASPRLSDEFDEWSIKLGHANYHIFPEPYLPAMCDVESCRKLLRDWKLARSEYLRHAARVLEEYGAASSVYKLSREKWEAIDNIWRADFRGTQANLACNPLPADLQELMATPTFAISDKFSDIDACEIVGTMFQFSASTPVSPTRKSTLVRLFTEPASVLRKA